MVGLFSMRILAIETSCDETGIALVEGVKEGQTLTFTTLKAALLSQAMLHSPYGGVYPTLAKREHKKNLPVLFEQFNNESFDAVAVTHGPGLEPALWTGVEFAKKVAAERGVPLLATNHMEGHLISSLARRESTKSQVPNDKTHSNILQNTRMTIKDVQLPVLALLISGGHTEFVLMKEWLKYEVVGKTLDDAVGEAFDKVAHMLGLPYPGGPAVSALAETARSKSQKTNIKLPRPMINSNTCDFSFSGLKTAALYALRDKGGVQKLSSEEIAAFAAELEDAIAEVLVSKTRKALWGTDAKTFVIGGGVAANRYIREQIEKMILDEFPDVDLRLPPLNITGDNAIMIAQAALARALSGKNDTAGPNLRAVGNLSIAS